MKLRRRLGLAFAAATSITLASSFAVTLTAFKAAQERHLNQSIRTHAFQDAEALYKIGGDKLQVPPSVLPGRTDIEGLAKYRILYRLDGTVILTTGEVHGDIPSLKRLGWNGSGSLPIEGLNFGMAGKPLRGILVRVGPPAPARPAGLLLVAAPRGELDGDATDLEELMAAVLTVAVAASLLVAFFLGGRLTQSIEAVTQVARRVSEGELTARVEGGMEGQDDEVRGLASDLNQMIERLSGLINAGQRFVSDAAHELRSPLAALRGELELALRRPRPAEALKESIQEALDDVNRLIKLSEDLLTLARLQVQKSPEAPSTANLRDVVNDAVRASKLRAMRAAEAAAGFPSHPHFDLAQAEQAPWAPKTDIEVQIPDVRVCGRGADLARMLRNLIDNALEHAPPGTPVRVIGEAKGAELLELRVEDNGPGVTEEARAKIFEPFFRGDHERERSGAGLGLAIAREIARVHGGELHLVMKPGVTSFTATLRRAG